MGYGWWPLVRLTPQNGPVSVIDLRNDLLSVQGPTKVTGPRPKLVQELRETVNRRLRPRVYGIRWEIRFVFEVVADMADHDQIVALVNAYLRRDTTIELSLNGDEVYRECVISAYEGPEPLAGKTFVGARYELAFQTVDLVDELPAIGSVLSGPVDPVPSAW